METTELVEQLTARAGDLTPICAWVEKDLIGRAAATIKALQSRLDEVEAENLKLKARDHGWRLQLGETEEERDRLREALRQCRRLAAMEAKGSALAGAIIETTDAALQAGGEK